MEKVSEHSNNISVSVARFPMVEKRYPLTRKWWEGLLQFRKRFLEDGMYDPNSSPYLAPDIAASWVRSRNAGVNPLRKAPERVLTSEEYAKILKQESQLIDIGRAVFNEFQGLTSFFASMSLANPNGLTLLNEGEPLKREWLIWDEATLGTSTISLCKRFKQPVQMLSPEHYSEDLASLNIVVSVAPVLDEKGEIVCFLIVRQPTIDKPWDIHFQMVCLHILECVTAMASRVEHQLRLNKINNRLENTENLLTTARILFEATLANINKGIITIDNAGTIVNANKEGCRIFNQRSEVLQHRNISEFLSNQSRIMDLVGRGEDARLEEIFNFGNNELPYVVNIQPAFDRANNRNYGAVLIFNSKKNNTVVNSGLGASARYNFEDLIGESQEFRNAIARGHRFANSLENILLYGESGTGKELFAHSIHNNHRPSGPFIAVNCAAVPRNLIESELFGYEGGSFTGAERNGRPGKIELANGGTLFLDEIGDMPLEVQAVLLRVLEDKQVMRIGGQRYNKVDFRLVAATNKNLHKLVEENLFREDLYYRLSVLSIDIPPLRKRGNDTEILSKYLVKNYCTKLGREVMQISPAALRKINEFEWPGNVRQLENAIIYAVNIAAGGVIELTDLPDYILLDSSAVQFDAAASLDIKGKILPPFKETEKRLIETAILNAKYDVAVASRMLNVSKSSVYRKIKEYNIEY